MLSEEQLERDFAGQRTDIAGYEDLRGGLVFQSGDAPAITIHDDLGYLARHLIPAVSSLRAGESVELLRYSLPGSFELIPEGEKTKLKFEDKEAEFPTDELVAAIVACVRRIAAALARLGNGDASMQSKAARLQARCADAETP